MKRAKKKQEKKNWMFWNLSSRKMHYTNSPQKLICATRESRAPRVSLSFEKEILHFYLPFEIKIFSIEQNQINSFFFFFHFPKKNVSQHQTTKKWAKLKSRTFLLLMKSSNWINAPSFSLFFFLFLLYKGFDYIWNTLESNKINSFDQIKFTKATVIW